MSEPDSELRSARSPRRGRRAGRAVLATLGMVGAFGAGIAVAWQMNDSAPWQGGAAVAAEGRSDADRLRLAQAPNEGAGSTAPAAPLASAASDAPAASGNETPFAQHARQAGANACAGLYATLGLNLTGGARYSLRSSWDGDAPDGRPIEGVAGLAYDTPGYSGTAAGYVLASPSGNSCAGTMVRVASFETSCEEVRPSLPAGSVPVEGIDALPVFEQPDGGKILLLPVGGGCAVVSTLAGIASPQLQESAQ